MGLHQDPDRLEEMGMREKEIRRRLWYSILELNVQSALDSGMSSMIADEDYNTKPPSIINDNDLEDGNHDQSARISFQTILTRSLPLRQRVIRVINSLNDERTYEEILTLGNELSSAYRNAAGEIEHFIHNNNPATKFASSYCIHLLRRFPLCLHFPYAIKSQKNPIYSFSQQVCLAASQDLVSLLDEDVRYTRLLQTGGAMFRDIITRSALIIFLGLCPAEADGENFFSAKRNRASKEPLLDDARRVVKYAYERMSNGETNVKVYVCLSMMLAQAEYRLNGNGNGDSESAETAVLNALHESLGACHDILQTRESSVAAAPDLGMEASGFGGLGMMPMMTMPDLDADFDFFGGSFGFDFSDDFFAQ